MPLSPRPDRITQQSVRTICDRLAADKPVRRRLPLWGRIHIDRQLPFLCVYRRPQQPDDGTDRFVLGEASYLTASGEPRLHRGLSSLVRNVAETLAGVFGAFLVVEIWSSPAASADRAPRIPKFRVFAPRSLALRSTLDVLESSLRQVTVRKNASLVETVETGRFPARGLPPLIPLRKRSGKPVYVIGLEIGPLYRSSKKGQLYPLLQRALHTELARVFKRTFFEFTRSQTTHLPPHYQALGRHSMVKAVWEVDRRLAEISNSFDFLLSVTPVNPAEAWNAFKRSGFTKEPLFVYRPLPVAPGLLKRSLYSIPIERIEDPLLAQLFREKQSEMDRQLTALLERDSRRFLYATLQLFGEVDDELLSVARDLLNRISPHAREVSASRQVDAQELAKRAEEEIAYFRRFYPEISAKVQIRDDVSGLMVSRGNLLVSSDTSIPLLRLEPLIQHEVGTHVLTYFNGRAQPFRQLYSGLAGYEELQEGIAVLAEHLVGGLSAPRLRLLAARVAAVRSLTDGASFVETFRLLDRTYQFSRKSAFSITMRVYRAGGLVKDAIYLRGLLRLLNYLQSGGEFEPLLLGKISADHVGVIRELLWRKVLRPAPLRPRYLDDPLALQRLERLRSGVSLLHLVQGKEKKR